MYEVCELCDGEGEYEDDDGIIVVCPECEGDGRIETFEEDVDEDLFDEDENEEEEYV